MNLTLVRDATMPEYTQGVMSIGDLLRLQTIERPWIPAPPGLGGAQHISCVPRGTYELVLHDTEMHPRSFALVNPTLDVYHEPGDVPQERVSYARTAILIHIANTAAELAGCIAVGMARAPGFISSSAIAMARFNYLVPWTAGNTLSIS